MDLHVFVWVVCFQLSTESNTEHAKRLSCVSEYDLCAAFFMCVCAAATVGAFRYGVINHRPSSDVNFFVNATVSSLSADWKIWEALFICTLLTPPSRGNGAGCVQAINATTMPKVVICHTPVIHNHYMECNAAKLPGLGWCCDSVCPRVSMVLFPHTQKKKYTSWTTVSCNMFCFFFVLHLCLCLCKAICCLKKYLLQRYLTFLSLCRAVFPFRQQCIYNLIWASACCFGVSDCHLFWLYKQLCC